ncbi:hypothetical protein (plasmid) [Lactobacillus brevis] [Lactiplantibacillus mudanjiangensis]|uniref:hypothetical protein n=1 Tax=Lactiplantibacillus mudanjiangensis TaxID=1296538 RepID=UPI001014B379|nr:hypothetical protein (plasmid) [Lactobacillus brevis] [Lactiplantibacillus mudanjiangensis]
MDNMKNKNESVPCVVVEPANDAEFDGSVLNSKSWDRIVVVTNEGKKVAEINTDVATPATGYLVKMYPNRN